MNREKCMKVRFLGCVVAGVLVVLFAGPFRGLGAGPTGWTVVAWNNLGMHCMDSDYSIFSILSAMVLPIPLRPVISAADA